MLLPSILIAKTMTKPSSDKQQSEASRMASDLKKAIEDPSSPGHAKAVATMNKIHKNARLKNEELAKGKENDQSLER